MAIAPWIVSDACGERIEPLLPKQERRFRYPGRKSCPTGWRCGGLLLHTGIAWRGLPLARLGGVTARRLEEWRGRVCGALHALLLAELRAAGGLDWSRAVVDSSHVHATGRARSIVAAGSSTTCWSTRAGCRSPGHSPAATATTSQLIPLVDRVPPVRGRSRPPRGGPSGDRRPRLRPRQVPAPAPRARDHAGDRPPQTEHGSGLGRGRWVVDAPSPGYTTSNGCSSATTAATRSTKPSSPSAAASSASGGSGRHCDSSSKGLKESGQVEGALSAKRPATGHTRSLGGLRERRALENRDRGVPNLLPHVSQRAGYGHRARLRVVAGCARVGASWPLEEANNALQRDFLGQLVEPR